MHKDPGSNGRLTARQAFHTEASTCHLGSRAVSFLPLDGLRVLDVTSSLAGPYCTEILAALGADVVKVERPDSGDETRHWWPSWRGDGVMFLCANASKRSLALDLTHPDGLEALLRLADRADVFVQSLRAGTAERRGLGPEALRARNERLVYCSIGSFGSRGPLRERPGYDPLMQAFAGIVSVTGEPDRPGVRTGASLVDQGTGLWAALGILAALRERDATGRGRVVEVSLYETAIGLLPYHLTSYLVTDEVPGRHGTAYPAIVPYQTFAAADGELMLAAPNDRLFAALCAALDLPELPGDERFASNQARVAHREELVALLGARFAVAPRATWVERLGEAGVPAAPVQDVGEVARHEQTAALGLLQDLGSYTTVAPPLSADGERVLHHGPAPALGAHTAEVLAEAGYAEEEVAELSASGAVRLGNGPVR
jgi:crotonobetainyl-CoA:carnitine CoA-transferase CaiB-like acyl-CoA transferase